VLTNVSHLSWFATVLPGRSYRICCVRTVPSLLHCSAAGTAAGTACCVVWHCAVCLVWVAAPLPSALPRRSSQLLPAACCCRHCRSPRRLSCGQSLLLDCGEGALGALCRSYGTAAALRQVASLGCVWVSHRHAGGWWEGESGGERRWHTTHDAAKSALQAWQ
jgi:hypothetical protein